jgi:MerR family transcriptional regulator/heat shock protein HspR
LQRIQELTNEGVSLVGVQKILDLEAELAAARDRIAALEAERGRLQREKQEAVEATHRQYRRELVPLRSTTVVRFREQT